MRGLRVGIIGAGRSGVAAARLAARLGARVFISDQNPIPSTLPKNVEVESGLHSNKLLKNQLIIRSPGVSSHLSILKRIQRKGIPIWSELELASRYATPSSLVAITGTNGKTTTTTLVGALFKAVHPRTVVAGNIGTPLSDYALEVPSPTHAVVEVSSYQLEDIHTFHPHVSAILNITPDHLEHHGTMQAYAAAKARIFENQTRADVCVINADDPWCRRLAKKCPARVFYFSRSKVLREGIYWSKGWVHLKWGTNKHSWRLRTQLPGPHNIENILASIALGIAGGLPLSRMLRVLDRFPGVEHRLEWVRTLRKVRYVNDSKATNVDSTRVALESFQAPLLLIMGGEGKGAPYRPLRRLILKHVKCILLIGEDAPTISRQLRGTVPMEKVATLSKAVRRAAELAAPGEIVLLSPACASFDQYSNFEERGRDFKNLARHLK